MIRVEQSIVNLATIISVLAGTREQVSTLLNSEDVLAQVVMV